MQLRLGACQRPVILNQSFQMGHRPSPWNAGSNVDTVVGTEEILSAVIFRAS